MLTIDNQKYLLSLANLYSTDAISAIRKNEVLDDEYDKPECMDVIENNDFEKYSQLDTLVRDELMESLCDAFCFIDSDMLLRLSDIVINAIEDNTRVCKALHNVKAINAIESENKELQRINTMLLRYSRRLNPEIV